MKRSHSSWSGSVSCRLEWRPSRLLGVLLYALGALAAFSVLHCALPLFAALPLSVAVVAGTVWLQRRYQRCAPRLLVIPGDGLAASLDGVVLHELKIQWRGPLAFLAWKDIQGGHGHLVWWPDTLDARHRRELRLAAGDAAVSPIAATMAP